MLKLFPFQNVGSKFLQTHSHALLADEMGVGKTAQAIDAFIKLDLKSVLVVAPAVALYNWQAEFEKFAGMYLRVIEKDERPYIRCVCSFDQLTDHLEKYAQAHWDLVIIDECHGLKTPTAARTKAVMGDAGIIHHTDRLWLLSGTPAPNHAGELWVMLYTFGHTKLSYEGFINRYCVAYRTGEHGERMQIVGTNTKHSPELKRLLKLFSLRRLKKDVLDLPPMFHNPYYVKGDKEKVLKSHPELCEKMQGELKILMEKLELTGMGDVSDEKLLDTLQVLSRSISSLRRYHAFLKIEPVAKLVTEELKIGLYDKIIIFGIHKDVLRTLNDHFFENGIRSLLITGETKPARRKLYQDLFQSEHPIKIILGNIQAMGINLTLTAASQVLFIEQDWVPGNNKQAADRAHRYGQKHSVSVRHIAIKDSIDAKITATLARKTQEISTFIE